MEIKVGTRVRLLEDCKDVTSNGMPPPKKGDVGTLTDRNVKVEGATRRVVRVSLGKGSTALMYADQVEAV